MSVVTIDDFRVQFDQAFGRPTLESERANRLWLDLLMASEELAGPLYSIKEDGQCDWIFHRHQDRFYLATQDDFANWARQLAQRYAEALALSAPVTPEERRDLERLKRQSEGRQALVEFAVGLQRSRGEQK